MIEENQAGGGKECHLPADFAADTAAGTGDQNTFATQVVADLFDIETYGRTSEQIFDLDIANLQGGILAVEKAPDRGQNFRRDIFLATDFDNPPQDLWPDRSLRNNHLIDPEPVENLRQIGRCTENRDAEETLPLTVGVAVDKTDHLHVQVRVLADFADEGLPDSARADNQHGLPVAVPFALQLGTFAQHADGNPHAAHEEKAEKTVQNQQRARKSIDAEKKEGDRHQGEKSVDIGPQNHQHIGNRNIAPPAGEEAVPPENRQFDGNQNRQQPEGGENVLFRDLPIETEKKGAPERYEDNDRLQDKNDRFTAEKPQGNIHDAFLPACANSVPPFRRELALGTSVDV